MTERPEVGAPWASGRSIVLAAACLLGDSIIGHGWAAETADKGRDTTCAAPAFPLAVRPGKRYLEDAAALSSILIESAYENEHDVRKQRLRAQAYQAVLSGAAGQVFGNNPIWHFDRPGFHPASVTWQEALASRGAQSMTHLHDLLTNIPRWLLVPDSHPALLTDGLGREDGRAVAARWYDPANGRFSVVGGSPLPATGPRRFKPEPNNSSGFDDWVLVLESPA